MFCTKCGSKVEGRFCSSCGSPVEDNNLQQNNLIIERVKGVMGVAINIDITVDNSNIIKLPNGSKLTYNLEPGVHTITYKVWCRRQKDVSINVEPGKNYYIKFVYDPLWGGFKISKDSILK